VLWCLLRFPHKTLFGSSLPPVVCGRGHVLFVGGVISCLWDGSCLVCGRGHVLFVGGVMSCLCCLCLFKCRGVRRVLCCVFALFSLDCPSLILPFGVL
jgi:hypothetical protein